MIVMMTYKNKHHVITTPKLTSSRPANSAIRDDIKAMILDNLTAAEMADCLGVKKRVIYDHLTKLGYVGYKP